MGPIQSRTCEGEQWDGEDSYDPTFANDPNSATPCTGQQVDPTTATYDLAVFECYAPSESPNDPTHAVGLRVTGQGNNNQLSPGNVYVMTRIFSVGRTGVAAQGCITAAGASCQTGPGGLGSGQLAWYGQDDTPLNPLATAISTARLTQGQAGDGDCTQAEYAASDVNNPSCTRDNTAITIDLLG